MGDINKLNAGIFAVLLFFSSFTGLFPATNQVGISALLDWEKGELEAVTDLDLASTGLRFPSGRNQAEEILRDEYLGLIRPLLLSLQVDSSDTLEDLIHRGDLDLKDLDNISLGARAIPPGFSTDFTRFTGRYTLNLGNLSAALIRHQQGANINRPLIPSPSANYTGIIIIADHILPVHGRNSSALLQPCLFPKIWDTEMNLIFERNLTDPAVTRSGQNPVVRYARTDNIFRPTPSGLNDDLISLVGERPLRIFARSVYGLNPTDPIIDRADAQLILSTENNRRLLQEGKVAIVINDSMLKIQK